MSKNNGKINGLCVGEERKTCRRCHEKFTIKVGVKNNGYKVKVDCPYCGEPNYFLTKVKP